VRAEDEDLARQGRLLNSMVFGLMAVIVAAMPLYLRTEARLGGLIAATLQFTVCAVAYGLSRWGRVRLGGYVFLGGLSLVEQYKTRLIIRLRNVGCGREIRNSK
jgi:hypothetical protein